MDEIVDPTLGFRNPLLGPRRRYAFNPMKGRKKTPKVPGFMRTVLAVNVRLMMDRHYVTSSNKPRALAKDAGVALSTIQRMLNAAHGPSLDTIEAVASVFQLSSYQLLIPALHVDNPQVVHGATKDEERLYRTWRRGGAVLIDTGQFAVARSKQ